MDKELRFSGIAARLAGIRKIFPRRGIDYPLKNRIQYRFTYNHLANAIIANSYATKSALLRNAPWLHENRIKVIYNGINPEKYRGSPQIDLRKELQISHSAMIVAFVGQLDERKGIQTLLMSMKRVHESVPGAVLVLVGEGPLYEYINEYVKSPDLEDVIRMTGFRSDIPEILKNIDLLVLPSLWEGFGLVLIEAMAASKACITTQISSMPEIVQNGETGLIVPVNNPKELANAIIKMLTDKRQLKLYGENGRQRVLKMFTLSRMIDELEQLFRDF